MRTPFRKILLKAGFEIKRIPDKYQKSIYQRLYSADVLDQKPFFNIGAGAFYHPYWTNIDYETNWYCSVQKKVIHHDLMSLQPLPIASGQAKILYTSHTIEHITSDAVQYLFKEAHRCLESGGIFRITTGPDADTDFRALMNNDEDWFYWDNYYSELGSYEHIFRSPASSVSLAERWLHHVASQLSANDLSPSELKMSEEDIFNAINQYGFPDVLDYFCSICQFQPERPGNHISWWTHAKIEQYLLNAGFTTIYRSGFGQSVSPILRNTLLFDSTHPQISIYMEAQK